MEEGQCVGADHVSRVVAQDDTHPVHQSRAEENGATFHATMYMRTYSHCAESSKSQ